MELLSLLELCGCFFDGVSLLGAIVDFIAWIMGTSNRKERQEAVKAGVARPPLDAWNWTFRILTPVVLLCAALLIWKWVRWARGS